MCYKFVKIMKKVTLKTLAEATAQEVFDQVAKHLLEQGKRSMKLNVYKAEICLYRGPEGTMCAAGCLISDNEYKDDMEGGSWENLVKYGYTPETHKDLISYLQRVHDQREPSTWREGLLNLCQRFDLNPQIITP
jgi:hypothetical protein